jgi:hypothetical protein
MRLAEACNRRNTSEPSVRKIRTVFDGYSDALLEQLDTVMESHRPGVRMVCDSIAENLPEVTVREHLAFFDLFGHLNHIIAKDMVRSLHRYRQLPKSPDLSAEGSEVLSRCRALLVVMEAATVLDLDEVFRAEDAPFVLKDDRLVGLVLAHSADADRIARLIRHRGTADPEMIAAILGSVTPSLDDGLL